MYWLYRRVFLCIYITRRIMSYFCTFWTATTTSVTTWRVLLKKKQKTGRLVSIGRRTAIDCLHVSHWLGCVRFSQPPFPIQCHWIIWICSFPDFYRQFVSQFLNTQNLPTLWITVTPHDSISGSHRQTAIRPVYKHLWTARAVRMYLNTTYIEEEQTYRSSQKLKQGQS